MQLDKTLHAVLQYPRKKTRSILVALANFRSWRIARQLVIFESDDWGSARIRDRQTRESLLRGGIDVDRSPYDRFDCLETREDLDGLFNVLTKYKSNSGNRPVFTFNTVMGNPDFRAIRAAEFRQFEHEMFFDSYARYKGQALEPYWRQAIRESLIKPQFHAREHLNIRRWLRDLRSGCREVQVAFDHDYYALTTDSTKPGERNYLAAYWPESEEHFEEIREILQDGLRKFEQVFGFPSRSLVPCNFVMPIALESTVREQGIRLIQGQRGQIQPSSDGATVTVRRSYTGQRNLYGQFYSVRNVTFEPFEDPSRDWVASALRDIESAFFWDTPAIVSTHRVNYVSGMDIGHRDRNLRLLDTLLKKIIATWPDVEFVTSDELIPIMAD